MPAGDLCTNDSMPQPCTASQASQVPSSQTPLSTLSQDPLCHFGTSSRGRKRTMSYCMQDATAEDHLFNLTQAMVDSQEIVPTFLGYYFGAWHAYRNKCGICLPC